MTKKFGQRYIDYRKQYLNLFKKEYELDFPLYIMLEQTYQCNLRCPSCIHGYLKDKNKFNVNKEVSVMTMQLYKKIIDEAAEYKCPSLAMMGYDEPLLVKNLPERINYAREKGFMDIIMTTNGNLFDENKIKQIVDAGITRILFSVDAATSETYKITRPGKGSFTNVIRNMRLLKEYKEKNNLVIPYTRASMVVTKNNENEYVKFREKFIDLVDGIEFQTFSTYYNKNTNIIPTNAEKIVDFSCSEPWARTIIRQNGDVLPCCTFYGYELPMGSIKKETIYNIYNSKEFKKIKQEVKSKEYSKLPCIECSNSFYTSPDMAKEV